MNEITNPGVVKFVSENAGLQYDIIVGEEKLRMKFVNGVCELEANSPLAKAAKEKYDAQFESDGKGGKRLKGKIVAAPFVPYDEFQASIIRTPIKIELGKGKFFEVTPAEIQEWHDKAKLYDEIQAKPKTKGGKE